MKTIRTRDLSRFLVIALVSFAGLAASAQELAITRNSTNVTLTWSTNYPDFVLESTGSLTGTWTNEPAATNGGASLPRVSSSQFFRLKETVSVTYVLNEGFLLQSRGKKVLIDGLIDKGMWDFYGLSGDVLNQETNALPPFTNIDVMLFSHGHPDHLQPRYAFWHMTNDPTPLVLGSQTVYNTMRTSLGSGRFATISNRIVTASPPNGSSTNVQVAGIDFKVVGLSGSEATFNTGFLFTLGGLRFLHVGDNFSTSLSDYTPMEGEQIDVAMINRLLFDNPQGAQEVINLLHPGAMFIVNQGPDQIENYRNIINSLTNVPPFYLMSTNPMITFRFPAR